MKGWDSLLQPLKSHPIRNAAIAEEAQGPSPTFTPNSAPSASNPFSQDQSPAFQPCAHSETFFKMHIFLEEVYFHLRCGAVIRGWSGVEESLNLQTARASGPALLFQLSISTGFFVFYFCFCFFLSVETDMRGRAEKGAGIFSQGEKLGGGRRPQGKFRGRGWVMTFACLIMLLHTRARKH